jgi:DNA repair protein RecN (Recombination protein N)
MLTQLSIENFILVERLDLHFQAGLTVLTGETGAGKSILLDALEGVLGGKLSATVIRPGASRALLEAHFQPPFTLEAWLTGQGLEPSEELVVSREITPRSSRYRVNGVLVPQGAMSSLRELLLDVTAQGQALTLSRSEVQLQLLDNFIQAQPTRLELQQTFGQWQQARQQLTQAKSQQQQEQAQKDRLRQEYQELKQAQLQNPQEIDDLLTELERLRHAAELTETSQMLYGLLHRGSGAVDDQLNEALRLLGQMVSHDPSLTVHQELLGSALVQVQECARQIHQYGQNLEMDPARLSVIEQRLRLLHKLCQKYGPTLAEVIAHQQHIQEQWQALKAGRPSLSELQTQLNAVTAKLNEQAQALSQLRQAGALRLEAAIHGSLSALGMAKARFIVQLTPATTNASGQDAIEFLLSANPGQAPAPLKAVASGGEMSRFLLALKVCLGEAIPTMVFDEIDVGVSGKVAQAVATHLLQLSQRQQVLCVTHQPLVAAMAQAHWRVRKVSTETATSLVVDTLDGLPERTEELAQLAGGNSADQAREFVSALLEEARLLQAAAH